MPPAIVVTYYFLLLNAHAHQPFRKMAGRHACRCSRIPEGPAPKSLVLPGNCLSCPPTSVPSRKTSCPPRTTAAAPFSARTTEDRVLETLRWEGGGPPLSKLLSPLPCQSLSLIPGFSLSVPPTPMMPRGRCQLPVLSVIWNLSQAAPPAYCLPRLTNPAPPGLD